MGQRKIIEVPTAEGYDQWALIYETDKNPLTVLDQIAFVENFPIQDLSGKRILDLGCGTGRITQMLADEGGIVTGVDVSEGMMELAKNKKCGNIRYLLHDLSEKLPFENESFDYVISTLVLEHIKDLNLFFSEIARVCRNEARIYITAMHPAMMLKGNQANFTDPESGNEIRPKGYPHQISDFIVSMVKAGLSITFMNEYSGTEELANKLPKAKKYLNWPMLVCFNLKVQHLS